MARLSLTFAGEAELAADLLPDDAPRTVAALLALFAAPRATRAVHAMYDGPEIMAAFAAPSLDAASDLAAAIRALPPENATVTPVAGDVLWFRFPANTFTGQREELWEVAAAYAPGVRLFGPLGWSPASVVGRVVPAERERLARIGRSLRTEGAQDIVITTLP